MAPRNDSLVFAALGGLGEIGMNLSLYGFGPENRRQWLMVDCGVSFAGEDVPGVDLVLPDIRFIEEERKNLVGIVITHAHEDHIGAIADLWPRLRVPVYATPFAAGLLEARRLSEPGAPKVEIHVVPQGGRVSLPPFDCEFIPVAHSIPEACALAIRTPLGLVVHSGDWKIDPTPPLGLPTDEARLRELGEEGVLALVCDSTNVLREGISPSEADVAATLAEIIKTSPARVAVTTFASNVARLHAVARAAALAEREVVVFGRAMERALDVAGDCGYLEGLPPFRSPDVYGYLPRDKVVALLTGSQGEPRAALARVATDSHPDMTLAPGDRVIFSSRTIPGNERSVNRIINSLAQRGIEIITDRNHLVHVSGHPRRGELEALYGWLKPRIAIPAHGEALHLTEHKDFARAMGVPEVLRPMNGDVVQLAPGKPSVVDQLPVGRVYKDGTVLVDSGETVVPERRRLSFSGVVTISLALDSKGDIAADSQVSFSGLPEAFGADTTVELIADAIADVLDGLPRAKRRDPDSVAKALERAVRSEIQHAWGKKPTCHVHILAV
ncbi:MULTISPECIES: ribonuclease J [unclassified Chelatococcus]|uniref:ribonuclease J n=1 Tax=unclassified Chelatococcus TaxID=2638111 RepID=UPI001BD00C80|nr:MULTISPECIES: ribonuclease J [unclassified Chelatococcus]MBS7699243.1 ribonuclease J [Chelatococcus sp. YT9]MBX3557625.1 ribonuclease J [Chelatococcus sp.]